MDFFFVFIVMSFFGSISGKLLWKNITRKNFSVEHNQEMLEAFAQDSDYFRIISILKLRKKNTNISKSTEETIFTLYTRKTPEGVRVSIGNDTALSEANFDPQKETFFLTHGFLSGADAKWLIEMKTSQLDVKDCNFFTIDWGTCAVTLSYVEAVECLPKVGQFVSQIIQYLGSRGIDYKKIHLIGHSLGAHLVAQVSVHGIKNSLCANYSGLDPAGPLFDEDDTDARIDPGDAELVDVIHTSRGIFGYEDPIGHWDFYPNGGSLQPGCFHPVCDHSKSHTFFTDTIKNNTIYPAAKCKSLQSAFEGHCNRGEYYMGVLATQAPPGIYYVYLSPKTFAELKIALLAVAVFLLLTSLIVSVVKLIGRLKFRILNRNVQETSPRYLRQLQIHTIS